MTDASGEPSNQQEGPSPGPLFIVGCARTGSTLLHHVLNRSPGVCVASETHFLPWARKHRLAHRLQEVRASPRRREALAVVADAFYRPDFWIWLRRNVTPDEMVDRLLQTDLSVRAVFTTLLELNAERRCNVAPATTVLGEKTPRHLHHVPMLNAWFPNARFIHTMRDPRAIYASELRRLREGRWGPKARLPRVPDALIDPLLPTYEAASTARAWTDAVRLHARYQRELGDRYHLVRFEDLVANPEHEVRVICDFIGVEFDPSMLEGITVVGSSFHADRHASAGFERASAERWRQEVHPVARSWFSLALGRRLRRFGYQP